MEETIEEALEKADHDDLSNLTGLWKPWEPFLSSGPTVEHADAHIEALDGLDKGLDEDFALDLEGVLPSSDAQPPPLSDSALATDPKIPPPATTDSTAAIAATTTTPTTESIEIY